MKTNLLLVGAFALLVGCTATAKTNEYVVIAGKSVVEDSLWNQVAQALVEKHGAASLSYNESPEELLPQLRELRPRYVAIVEKPENLGRDYVIALNQMSRRVDNDIYADFLWGIITGYDAAAAMKMVDNSTEPLVMKDAVATITELSSGKWFDRFAWIAAVRSRVCSKVEWGGLRSRSESCPRFDSGFCSPERRAFSGSPLLNTAPISSNMSVRTSLEDSPSAISRVTTS